MKNVLFTVLYVALGLCVFGQDNVKKVDQISIPWVEKMPRMPQPLHITDWMQAATDYYRLVFNSVAIGNVKRWLLDMHHQLTKEYLQYYRNEFCYKFNRRYFGEAIFDSLIVPALSYNTDFKSGISNRSS